MKTRPILFSAPMVRAILAGTKTQTRRVVKSCKDMSFGCQLKPNEIAGEINAGDYTNSKFGQLGDQLWVRESFQPLFAAGVESQYEVDWKTGKGYAISYPATDGIQEYIDVDDNLKDSCKPSIHMPRWASRITLEIIGIRVEKLHDISESDARAEGADHNGTCDHVRQRCEDIGCFGPNSYRGGYAELWDQINGAGAWDANPYVWVISFKRVPQ